MTAGRSTLSLFGPAGLLVAWFALGSVAREATQDPERVIPPEGVVRVASPEAAIGPGITLLDGTTFAGTLEAITADGIRLSGKEETVPAYEVQEIRLPSPGPGTDEPDAKKPIDFTRRPLVRFRDGEQIAARVLEIVEGGGGKLIATIRPEGAQLPVLRVSLENVSAFRLREAHTSDELLSKALEKPAPESDQVFIRRAGLLSVAGTLRALTKDHLILERGEKRSRVRRQIVQGLILAPVATRSAESDPPAILELRGVGRLPAYLVGLERSEGSRTLVVRMPGAAKDSLSRLPLSEVRRITLASDRVLFLSAADPVVIDERPVVGKPLRYRKDKSVSGGPLSIAGRQYRRGLGVHSYCALDFNLAAQYRSFAAVIGLDDSSQDKGSVAFRVIADGKEIYKKEMSGKTRPETVSLPMENVQVLRLVVDYGADKLDFSDHANWADARVTK